MLCWHFLIPTFTSYFSISCFFVKPIDPRVVTYENKNDETTFLSFDRIHVCRTAFGDLVRPSRHIHQYRAAGSASSRATALSG
jgi:hypothetical protein